MNVDTVGQAAAAAAPAPAAAAAVVARRGQQQRVVAPAGAPLMSAFFVQMRLYFSFSLLRGRSLTCAFGAPREREDSEREDASSKAGREKANIDFEQASSPPSKKREKHLNLNRSLSPLTLFFFLPFFFFLHPKPKKTSSSHHPPVPARRRGRGPRVGGPLPGPPRLGDGRADEPARRCRGRVDRRLRRRRRGGRHRRPRHGPGHLSDVARPAGALWERKARQGGQDRLRPPLVADRAGGRHEGPAGRQLRRREGDQAGAGADLVRAVGGGGFCFWFFILRGNRSSVRDIESKRKRERERARESKRERARQRRRERARERERERKTLNLTEKLSKNFDDINDLPVPSSASSASSPRRPRPRLARPSSPPR